MDPRIVAGSVVGSVTGFVAGSLSASRQLPVALSRLGSVVGITKSIETLEKFKSASFVP